MAIRRGTTVASQCPAVPATDRTVTDAIKRVARPLDDSGAAYDALLDRIGEARFVLLGEASHGTHEFYAERARITERLIAEKGFSAVAIEADWPDAYRVARYVRGDRGDRDAEEALEGFERFPTWMWRNADVVEFISWLHDFNRTRPPIDRVGFYGLDLYSLFTSIDAVIRYLDRVDADAARRARARYGCFDHFADDGQGYGYASAAGVVEPCETEVMAQLRELQRAAPAYTQRDGRVAEDEFFFAEQNARLAKNAEEYYRTMFRGRAESWNLRDRHMAETLDALVAHLARRRAPVKTVVWAHNSHLGDARATAMAARGELNLGQLIRQSYGADAFLVGFTTHDGTVTAATDWDGLAETKVVRPSLAGSIERACHETGVGDFLVDLRGDRSTLSALAAPRLERAIGVIYRPDTERASHYFEARVIDQFDALIHIDHTTAVQPLERRAPAATIEPAETYPTGL